MPVIFTLHTRQYELTLNILLHVFGYHSLARQRAMKDNVVQQTFQDVCEQPCFHL